MTAIRKPNRRSGPARVTQAGTSTSYPHPDHAGLARRQGRWAEEDPWAADDYTPDTTEGASPEVANIIGDYARAVNRPTPPGTEN